MKVLYAASEIVPFASTGGLADIAGGLPKEMVKRGVDVQRVMPLYRRVAEGGFAIRDTGLRLDIPVGFKTYKAEIWVADQPAPVTYFIRRDEFFDRSQLYSLPERDYEDNFERFVFFQKAVVALIDSLGQRPDIIHCSDWQTGLLPLFLKYGINGMGRSRTEKVIHTVHNLAYQGIFPGSQYALTNLPFSCFSIDFLEFYGQVNCMKAGLTTSDLVTTVSKTYSREIRTEAFGFGLHGVLNQLGDRLVGIINGVDYTEWDASKDTYLAKHYTEKELSGKKACRDDLGKLMGLKLNEHTLLIGMVARLVDQKGLDILADAMPTLMNMDVAFALLGVGQEKYHILCKQWAEKWPNRFAVRLDFDNRQAHKIGGGADLFLMPSKFEPCGLSQLRALRYGTVPVVHATGGLEDTVEDVSEDGSQGTGFKFRTYTAEGLLNAISRASSYFVRKDLWKGIIQRCMQKDFSWERAAEDYLVLYRKAKN